MDTAASLAGPSLPRLVRQAAIHYNKLNSYSPTRLATLSDDDDPDSVTLSVALAGTCGPEVSDSIGMDDDYDFVVSGNIPLTRESGESTWKKSPVYFPIYNYDTDDDGDYYFRQEFEWALTVDGIVSWTNVSAVARWSARWSWFVPQPYNHPSSRLAGGR